MDLADRYKVTSNRESGLGRYDMLLNPKCSEDDGIILEFKVHDPDKESSLKETVQAALSQIEEKGYEQSLLAQRICSNIGIKRTSRSLSLRRNRRLSTQYKDPPVPKHYHYCNLSNSIW